MWHLPMLVIVAGCGRIGFDSPEPGEDAAVDTTSIDTAMVSPTYTQRVVGYSSAATTNVTLVQPVAAGSALVVFALSQQQPVISIADSRGHTWLSAGTVIHPMTGSKVDAWITCGATSGMDTVSVTQSFINGPVHVAVYEVTGAAPTSCLDQQGQQSLNTVVVDQMVTSTGVTASSAPLVLAGFGAWFDVVTYTAEPGDTVTATMRPTGTAPMGDTLATVVSKRSQGAHTVRVRADHATHYAALLVTVR